MNEEVNKTIKNGNIEEEVNIYLKLCEELQEKIENINSSPTIIIHPNTVLKRVRLFTIILYTYYNTTLIYIKQEVKEIERELNEANSLISKYSVKLKEWEQLLEDGN